MVAERFEKYFYLQEEGCLNKYKMPFLMTPYVIVCFPLKTLQFGNPLVSFVAV